MRIQARRTTPGSRLGLLARARCKRRTRGGEPGAKRARSSRPRRSTSIRCAASRSSFFTRRVPQFNPEGFAKCTVAPWAYNQSTIQSVATIGTTAHRSVVSSGSPMAATAAVFTTSGSHIAPEGPICVRDQVSVDRERLVQGGQGV
jgi:hypothetical protein